MDRQHIRIQKYFVVGQDKAYADTARPIVGYVRDRDQIFRMLLTERRFIPDRSESGNVKDL